MRDAEMVEPCKTCPWRRSSTVGGADIPRFNLDLMRKLRNTCGQHDDFRPVMACHGSKDGAEFACRGYVAQEGIRNLQVRLMAAQGVIPAKEIAAACELIELWPDFETMLKAYEEAHGMAR